jgi:DNA-binding transcriptional regulator LsrR (DeoR family)
MEKEYKELSKQISSIDKSMQHLLAIELYKLDMTQEEIGKHLGIAKGSVNKLLRGIKKQK